MNSLIPEVIFDEIVKSVGDLRPYQTALIKDMIKNDGKVIIVSTPARRAGKSLLVSVFEELARKEEEEERKRKEWQEKYGKEKVLFT